MIKVYNEEKNPFLKNAKNLVPRTITFEGNVAFGLVDKRDKSHYYCFFTNCRISDIEPVYERDVISELSLMGYFNASEKLLALNRKLNLRKIIYDSNRNK